MYTYAASRPPGRYTYLQLARWRRPQDLMLLSAASSLFAKFISFFRLLLQSLLPGFRFGILLASHLVRAFGSRAPTSWTYNCSILIFFYYTCSDVQIYVYIFVLERAAFIIRWLFPLEFSTYGTRVPRELKCTQCREAPGPRDARRSTSFGCQVRIDV